MRPSLILSGCLLEKYIIDRYVQVDRDVLSVKVTQTAKNFISICDLYTLLYSP